MRVDGPEVNPATCEPQAGRAHADRADTGHDLALGQMPVANQLLLAFLCQKAVGRYFYKLKTANDSN